MPRRKIRRKTHICPNCETVLEREENYCHECGQENHNLNVPMRDLIMEIIGSFTFFETKFIETAKIIFTHPGRLTLEFNSGRRAKYMHPVRMYFWVSAIFFFTVALNANKTTSKKATKGTAKSEKTAYESGRTFGRIVAGKKQVAENESNKKKVQIDTKKHIGIQKKSFKSKDSSKKEQGKIWIGMIGKFQISQDSIEYYYKLNDDELDSVLIKNNVSTFYSNRKLIRNSLQKNYDEYLQKKYGIDSSENRNDRIMSAMPNLIFIMLPFAAFILWMFEKHTKWRFYFQHLVFTLNTHSAIFLMFTFFLIFDYLVEDLLGLKSWKEFNSYVGIFIVFLCFLYFYISIKRVYLQSWLKTTIKFFLLTLSYGVTLFLLLVIGIISGLIPV